MVDDKGVERDRSKVDFTAGDTYKFYPDNPTHESHKSAFRAKEASQFYDPCLEASKMSLKCLERNNYDRDKCLDYFSAYRECKKDWTERRKQDRVAGNKW